MCRNNFCIAQWAVMPNIYLPPVSPASVHLATRSHLDFCLMAPSPDFFASQMFLDMEIRTVHLFIELDSEFIPSKSDSEYSVFICERWQLFADSTGVYCEYRIPLSPLKSHFMPKIWYYHLKWREISWCYGSKKFLWIQSVFGLTAGVQSPKCSYGGGVTSLGLSPKQYQFFYRLPLVGSKKAWLVSKHQ